jgi:hypothetical protein
MPCSEPMLLSSTSTSTSPQIGCSGPPPSTPVHPQAPSPVCAPHRHLQSHEQPPHGSLTGIILRSVNCCHGATPMVSPSPSFASNGFTHRRTHSRATFPTCPRRRFTRLMAAQPPSRHRSSSAPHSLFSPWATSPARSWAGQFRPMVNRKIYSFPRNFSVNQFKIQTLKFN